MKYQIILLAVLLVSTLQQSKGQHLHCSLEENFSSKQRNEEDTFLKHRPIQQNIVIMEDRTEVLTIEVSDDMEVSHVKGEYVFPQGQFDRELLREEIEFVYSDQIGTHISTPIDLPHEDWIETYLVKVFRLDLEYYSVDGNLLGTDHFDLTYFDVNSDFLESFNEPSITYLTEDSTIIHLGNSIYLEFNRLLVNADRNYSQVGYDYDLNISHILDSVWEEDFFSTLGSDIYGLQNLNSNVYSIPLNGGSGNYFDVNSKSGSTPGFIILESGTFVHELFHMFQPHFFNYFVHSDPNNPLYKIGNFDHNPVQFFGQSAFGRHYPLPDGYPNLCPEDLERIDTLDTGYKIVTHDPCREDNLNLVDGIAESVSSNFELYIMDLVDESVLDSVMYFGFNPSQEPDDRPIDSVLWKFDTLISLTKNQIVTMKETWYSRDDGAHRDYYDAKNKNLLITYHAGGKRSLEELKMLHILSNELIADKPQNEIPEYRSWGYRDDVYDRYISYEQATLGLGKLTNEFPLPPSYTMTTSNDDNSFTDPIIKIYPNPATEEITIEGIEPDIVEIYGMDGRKVLTEEKTKLIKVIDLSSGMFIIKIRKDDMVWSSKLFLEKN